MDRCALAMMAVLVAAGCGGSPAAPPTPATPAPTPTPAPTARDGWTEGPIGAVFSPPEPRFGARLLAQAPGFLDRDVVFDGTPLYLWPQDVEYVRSLVYSEYVPGRRLTRWAVPFDVVPLEREPASVLEGPVSELRRVTGLDITIRDGGGVRAVVDPDDPLFAVNDWIAFARLTFSGNTVVGATMVFRSPSDINRYRKDVLLHELGHVIGLGHSIDPEDVMHTGGVARGFGPRETVAIRMMYRWRRVGNTAPDRDPGPFASDAARTTVVIGCP